MFSKTLLSSIALAGLVLNALAAPTLKVLNAGAPGNIPNKYIVVLKEAISREAAEAHLEKITSFHSLSARDLNGAEAAGVERKFHFAQADFQGYSGGFDKATLSQILKSPEVAYVEEDAKVSLYASQEEATWGLDRISHETISTPYTYEYDEDTAGSGVTVYVIDTGIRITHDEFSDGDRATWGYNAVDNDNSDGNGHGTHCSGTIAGKTYGVAKKAQLVAVKVLDANGSGTNSGVIDGMNWVAENATPNLSVASMSLGGGKSTTINDAVNAIYKAGVTIVVAAGNDGADASNTSPASAKKAITVGAIDNTNARASFSNYGSVVDVFAPGVNVLSSWGTSDKATNTISGTSMACPHVAGLSAYFISGYGSTGATPAKIAKQIVKTAVSDQIKSPGSGSPNLIAYNGYVDELEQW